MPDLATLTPPPGCAPFRYPSDPLGFIAWRDFIAWAVESPEFRAAFTAATNRRFLPPPRSGLDAMIDIATGARDREAETLVAFIEWVNDAHWGSDMVSWQPLPGAPEAADA